MIKIEVYYIVNESISQDGRQCLLDTLKALKVAVITIMFVIIDKHEGSSRLTIWAMNNAPI